MILKDLKQDKTILINSVFYEKNIVSPVILLAKEDIDQGQRGRHGNVRHPQGHVEHKPRLPIPPVGFGDLALESVDGR